MAQPSPSSKLISTAKSKAQFDCVIDAGNTNVKIAFFDINDLQIGKTISSLYSHNWVADIITKNKNKIANTIYSSVRNDDTKTINWLQKDKNFHLLSLKSKMPFINKYATPATLGNDRKANMAAATAIAPNKNVLVIDAGTCIKLDMLQADNTYFGGAIHPGIDMRYKALHDYTGKLPLLGMNEKKARKLSGNRSSVSNTEFELAIGTTTEQSMRAGVEIATVNEIKSCILAYRKKCKNLQTIITGGDMRFFAEQMNFTFAIPNLTLKGLHTILKINMNE